MSDLPLKIKFVYQIESVVQSSMPFKRAKRFKKPIGMGHIFEVEPLGSLTSRSMCGIAKADVGKETSELEHRAEGLDLCIACSDAWKNNPRSEFYKWTHEK